ncbi:hypothetical protein ACFWNN_42825 [Lentzea sp. NPDC058450]|uniref:hypothetical protein n=1 Tax=Lentzea sp. NPDC058450 TaxID=3346505 RepID=UPI00364EAA5F
MPKPTPVQVLRDEGPPAFAFLVERHDFLGPELVDDGFLFHRPDLRISVSSWAWKGERGFTTTVSLPDLAMSADLSCLYVACGLGPAQAVGGSTGTAHVVRKRIAEHAAALGRVVVRLDGPERIDLVRRCRGRSLPD